jgi:hypothetical protein
MSLYGHARPQPQTAITNSCRYSLHYHHHHNHHNPHPLEPSSSPTNPQLSSVQAQPSSTALSSSSFYIWSLNFQKYASFLFIIVKVDAAQVRQ